MAHSHAIAPENRLFFFDAPHIHIVRWGNKAIGGFLNLARGKPKSLSFWEFDSSPLRFTHPTH
ncbi:hypothetical protein LKK83_13035 [Phormidium sp. CCY1219]|nr:hypothetical protein [Phormidium sp. CCY1219]